MPSSSPTGPAPPPDPTQEPESQRGRDQKDSVQRVFGAVAGNYAQASIVHRQGPDLDALEARLAARPAARALDVGCGAGHTTHALARHATQVIAVDLTEEMLEQTRAGAAEQGLANVEARRGDAEALPFEDASFDVVACRLCAHHFGDPERALREARRVLAPGGRFFLIDIVAPESPALDSFLQAFELVRDPSHVRDHSVAQWTAMLQRAGFELAALDRWPMPQHFEAWVNRIGANDTARAALIEMFAVAPDEVRAHFRVQGRPVEGFSIENALFESR